MGIFASAQRFNVLHRRRNHVGHYLATTVTTEGSHVIIENIDTRSLLRRVAAAMNSTRFINNFAYRIGPNHIDMPEWFVPDFVHVLKILLDNYDKIRDTKYVDRDFFRSFSKSKIQALIDLMIDNTWLKYTVEETPGYLDYKKIPSLIYKPLPYQMDFLKSYEVATQRWGLRGALLAATAGSGKTYMSLLLSECLHADKVIIVCPKSAIDRVWVTEIKSLFVHPQSLWVCTDGAPYTGQRYVVANYEYLSKLIPLANKMAGKTTLVVLDECHNLNDRGAKRTDDYMTFIDAVRSHHIVWASGTPLKALGAELVPLFKAIDPRFTEAVENRYVKIYGYQNGITADILQYKLGNVSFKVEKSTLGLLPPEIYKIGVSMPNATAYTLDAIKKDLEVFILDRTAYYKKLEPQTTETYLKCIAYYQDLIAGKTRLEKELHNYQRQVNAICKNPNVFTMGDAIKQVNYYEKTVIIPALPVDLKVQFKAVKSLFKYPALVIQGEALGQVLSKKRAQCHVDMVPYIDIKGICASTAKKTVVFTSFVDALLATESHLKKIGMKPAIVYGSTNNELSHIVKTFGDNPAINPLIATYQSLSTAVPLVMADTMILLNPPFREYIREQAISRIHRLGATTQTRVMEITLDTGEIPNISTRSKDILQWSREMVESIMGIKSPFDVEESGDLSDTYVASEMFSADTSIYLPNAEEKKVFYHW